MMMTAKMMETLKNTGIAKEWHKDSMHRLYVDLAKADKMYYDNNETFEHGRLTLNRYERQNGKLWINLETGEIITKNIDSSDDVVSQIMELIAFLTPAEEEEIEENTEETEETAVWYAVMRDCEDNDHSTGTFDLEEAIRMALEYRASGDTDAYVALIDPKDDYCIDEMHDL